MIQGLPDIFYLVDQQGSLRRWNQKGAELLGLSAEEMLKANVLAFVHEQDRPFVTQKIQEAFSAGSAAGEARMLLQAGIRDYYFSARKIQTGEGLFVMGIGIDITQRKQTEAALRASMQKYQVLFDGSRDALMLLAPPSWKFVDANLATAKLFGARAAANITDLGPWDVSPEFQSDGRRSADKAQEVISIAMTQGAHFFEWTHQRLDGTIFDCDVLLTRLEYEGEALLQATVRDITERKAAKAALVRANRALKTLSAGNLALIKAADEDALLHAVTNVLVETGGYSMAAVYYAENNREKSIVSKVASGIESNYFADIHLSWADTETDQLPLTIAIRTGTVQICRDIATDPAFKPWREAAQKRGYIANIAFPLAADGKVFGGLSIYASEAHAFDDDEVALLEELSNDLAYGIVMLRVRSDQQQSAAVLRQSLEQSVQTIASTLEARDPYTAGHQRRVAELARAIAVEMRLSEEQVNGIHFGSMIHDLGKIHIPAEILSKPGKLSDIEFMLIKTHSQAGYDIIKGVKFPWPIADMILQHHERLDGTGYPQGLKGAQIIPEAQILAVADVVEAMATHRPYRAALGIDAALAEISRMRGKHYDPHVVDACLKLFQEKKFTFQ